MSATDYLAKYYRSLCHSIRIRCVYRWWYGASVLHQKQHGMNRSQISNPTIKVVERLVQHGYQAFLVGGCVRDLLLQKAPKDFDVATNANPQSICRLFARARMIGKQTADALRVGSGSRERETRLHQALAVKNNLQAPLQQACNELATKQLLRILLRRSCLTELCTHLSLLAGTCFQIIGPP